MASSIKIRAKKKGGSTIVKSLISHPMETGNRRDESGKKVPIHFIQEVTCEHNGNVVLTGLWGAAVSKNPYLSFKFKGGHKKDEIKISWVDNLGKKDSKKSKIR